MRCPKCQQALEDGAESYICCANATLQWRCVKCAKVSEGFALPYGLCSHCGGKLEGVAIYNRFIGAEEAARNFEAYSAKLKARKFMPQITVEAKLLATSVVPDRRRIAPYHDALVINEYQVTQAIGKTAGWTFASKIESSTKIRVAQWGLIDEKPTDIAKMKVGDVRRLVLETYEKHPDKIDEVVTSNSLDIDPDVPMLYEPRP